MTRRDGPAEADTGAENPTATSAAAGHYRWNICALLFLSVAINYIDRNIIGILKQPLSQQLGWSETDYANIAAAFQFAYAFGYLFGGRLMDRIGIKRGLPLVVGAWSAAAVAHGLCSLLPAHRMVTLSLAWLNVGAFVIPLTALGFVSARVVLGLAEGGNFPGAIKAVAEWFPARERALATGIFNAGTNIGAIVCPFAVPRMYAVWGWPVTFYVTGALGAAWVALWWWLYENPEDQPRLSPAERAYIVSGRPTSATMDGDEARVSWLSLLRHRAVWAYLLMSVLAGPVWNIYMFFLPDFLQKRFHLDLVSVGDWTAVFYGIASVGGIAAGWLPAWLLGRGWTLNAARKTAMLACALAVVPIYVAPYTSAIWLTVFIVGIAGSAHQGWSANQFSFASDTMPRGAVSTLVGLGGFIAYFTGGFMTEGIGLILKATGSYASIFAAASVMYLASLLLTQLLVPQIGGNRAR